MRVTVGRIGKPHGIRGEVTVEPRTDEPDIRFAPGSHLLREEGPDLVVSSMHWHSGRLLLTLVGVHDRNAAEELRGTIVQVERADLETPDDPSEYYDSNLVGCLVVTVKDVSVGEVREVLHLPAQDLLVVWTGEREVLVPFVAEIVPEVDATARRIVINPPDGLLSDSDVNDVTDAD